MSEVAAFPEGRAAAPTEKQAATLESVGPHRGSIVFRLVTTSLVAALLMLASTAAALPSRTTSPLVVRATIWPNLVITFSPKTFKRGTVHMEVKNRTAHTHQFAINGVTWKSVKPHKVAAGTVTFKRPGIYQATLPDCGYLSMCTPTAQDTGPTGSVKVM